MSQNTKKKKGVFSTLGGWCRRMFLGSAKDIDVLAVEEIVSPGRALVKKFLSRKLAVVALVVLISMFLLVFIGPVFVPIDTEYENPNQKNTAPTMSLMKVPSSMKNQIKSISSYSTFTVGLSEDGKVYVWGNGQMGASTANLKKIPDEVRNSTIAFAAAGKDHAIAIDKDGWIYGWGVSDNGQYGDQSSLSGTYMGPILMKDILPKELRLLEQLDELLAETGKTYDDVELFVSRDETAAENGDKSYVYSVTLCVNGENVDFEDISGKKMITVNVWDPEANNGEGGYVVVPEEMYEITAAENDVKNGYSGNDGITVDKDLVDENKIIVDVIDKDGDGTVKISMGSILNEAKKNPELDLDITVDFDDGYTMDVAFFVEERVNINEVESLICGNQVSTIVMKDGSIYLWGNCKNGASNYRTMNKLDNVQKMVFTSNSAAALLKDGTVVCNGSGASAYEKIDMGDGRILALEEVIDGRKVLDIASTKKTKTLAFLLEDGEVIVSGSPVHGEDNIPVLENEKIVSIAGGDVHYSAVTDRGGVYTWGDGAKGSGAIQSGAPKNLTNVSSLFVGSFQNYAVDEDGKLVDTWGLKGYLFGTDDLGRDVLARVVNGGRMTMTIGAVAVIVSSIIGIIIGCLSGYFGGWVDMILMRITEIFSSIPFLPFALILSAVLSTRSVPETTRIFMIMVILGLLSWTGLARLVRAQVLAEREKEFVLAAKSMGVRERKIAFKHILPNVISVILVTMTLDFAGCMLTESSLSYLGFGVQLPRPTWGNMLDGCNSSIVIQNFWWRWLFPALFLGIATICINIIGDTLRDVMDPKSSSER